jgi:hypothetical protein
MAPTGLRDLWLHTDVVPGDTGYSGSIPGHGVILLRLAGEPVTAH